MGTENDYIDLNPFLGLLLELLDITGIIPDPIAIIVGLFTGRPKPEATAQTAQYLIHARNPAARIWGLEIAQYLLQDGAVLSSGDPNVQAQYTVFREQFIDNMEVQGYTYNAIASWVALVQSPVVQGSTTYPDSFQQPLPEGWELGGPQSIQTLWNTGYSDGEKKGLTGDALTTFATQYVLNNVKLSDLGKILIGNPQGCTEGQTWNWPLQTCVSTVTSTACPDGQVYDPTTGQCIPVVNGQPQCPSGYTWNPQTESCQLNPTQQPVCPEGYVWDPQTEDCIPSTPAPAPAPQPGGDELTICCQASVAQLTAIVTQLTTIAQNLAGLGQSGETSTCCSDLVAAINSVMQAIALLTDSLPAPVDLSGVVAAIDALNANLATIAAALGAPAAPPAPVDLTPVVNALDSIDQDVQTANALQDVPQALLDALNAYATAPGGLAQLAGGAAFVLPKTLLDWLNTLDKAGIVGRAVAAWNKNQPGEVTDLGQTIQNGIAALWAAGEAAVGTVFGPIIESILTLHDDTIANLVNVQPGQEEAGITALLNEAITAGMGAHLGAVLSEAIDPLKQLGFPTMAALLAQFAGFAEILAGWIGVEISEKVAKPHRYAMAAQARSTQYDARTAAMLEARGLIPAGSSAQYMIWAGYADALQGPLLAAAYRPVQPRMFATLLQDEPFPSATVASALAFAGLRPADQAFLLAQLELASSKNVRQQFLMASVRAAELGTITAQELTSDMNLLNYSQDAQSWVQLTVATRRLEQLAELYRKSVSEAYKYGLITDAQYVPALENIGISYADAEAHYAIDSIAKQGKALLAAERAAARLLTQQERAAQRAAIEGFRNGSLNAVELAAALAATGQDPTVTGLVVAYEEARQGGAVAFIYGVLLPRTQAVLLREQVTAIGTQVKAQLVTPDDALTQLATWNIPAANAEALVADWAAVHTTAADVGVRLPI